MMRSLSGGMAALLLLAWLPLAAAAQGRPQVGAPDLPARLAPAGGDWLAVGRLDVNATGFCTVTLISEDRALTAAHCLFDAETGRRHAPGGLVLRLGLSHGRAVASRGVREVIFARPPVAVSGSEEALRMVAEDMAILLLDRPVRLPQLRPVEPAPGTDLEGRLLTVVSYARGRSEAAALQDDCLMTTRRADGALMLDCEVDHGASGSPVMVMQAGLPRLVGVISARGGVSAEGFPDATIALAAPLDGPAGRALLGRGAGPGPVPTGLPAAAPSAPAGPRVRRIDTGSERMGIGARFVRP